MFFTNDANKKTIIGIAMINKSVLKKSKSLYGYSSFKNQYKAQNVNQKITRKYLKNHLLINI